MLEWTIDSFHLQILRSSDVETTSCENTEITFQSR